MKMLTEEEHAALVRDQERLIATSAEVARLQAELKRVTAERDDARRKLTTPENSDWCGNCSRGWSVSATAQAKLTAFKTYVHKRLDEAGVPADPEPEANAKHGCRIEGRLNWIASAVSVSPRTLDLARAERDAAEARAEAAEAELKRLQDGVAVADHRESLLRARAALADTDTRWLADKLAEASEAARVETKDELNAFHEQRLESARREALEEAARVLDRVPGFACGVEGGRWLTEMAKDIRALATAPAKGDDIKRAAAEAWVMAGPSDGGVLAWDRPPAPAKGDSYTAADFKRARSEAHARYVEQVEAAPTGRECVVCGATVPAWVATERGKLCPSCAPRGIPRVHSSNFSEPLNEDPEVLAACVDTEPEPPDAKCATCDGTGQGRLDTDCPDCGGTGRAGGGE